MKKSREHLLRRKIGDLNAHCGWKDYVLNDGPARGVRAFDLDNGRGIQLTVLADRGLDIAGLAFRGHQMAFLSKTGVKSPFLYAEDGARGFLRQFYAGLLTTCGLSYAGAACEEDGQAYGLHGPFSNTPAGHVNAEMVHEGDDAVIQLSGEIRQSEVFGDNLVLKRVLCLQTEQDVIHIRDTVENQGFFKSPLMLVYHVNFGYPMLDEGSRVYTSAKTVAPRDETAKGGMDRWNVMDEPSAQRPEECFFHLEQPQDAFAMLHSEKLGVAAIVRFDGEKLPLLCEWKCMREGDYALGLEPTTSGVLGRAAARKDGSLTFLKPGESREFRLSIEFTGDTEVIKSYIRRSI